jgi:hypothetical protein
MKLGSSDIWDVSDSGDGVVKKELDGFFGDEMVCFGTIPMESVLLLQGFLDDRHFEASGLYRATGGAFVAG